MAWYIPKAHPCQVVWRERPKRTVGSVAVLPTPLFQRFSLRTCVSMFERPLLTQTRYFQLTLDTKNENLTIILHGKTWAGFGTESIAAAPRNHPFGACPTEPSESSSKSASVGIGRRRKMLGIGVRLHADEVRHLLPGRLQGRQEELRRRAGGEGRGVRRAATARLRGCEVRTRAARTSLENVVPSFL